MNVIISAMKPEDAVAVSELSAQPGYVNTVPETLERIQYLQNSEQDCLLVALWENDIAGWVHAFKTTRLKRVTIQK